MTEREFLQIHRNNMELTSLQAKYDKIVGGSLILGKEISGMPYVGRVFDASMSKTEERMDIETQYSGLYYQNQLLINKARDYIAELPDMTLRMILTLKYINGMMTYDVAAAIGISEKMCQRILKVHFSNVF